ncbi:MAG: 2-C-methyl-D-erythritol 4-phosphate cytidylyltransferase [Chloroflexi bacterium]|nr:2-C-methyl-D-erythritol 4-phosphate cytidylyltransferase [Chloroflexota bacterium]
MGFDKLMADLGGVPLLARTVAVFEECQQVDEIVLVVGNLNLEWGRSLVGQFGWQKVTGVCGGGARRQDSVLRGIEHLHDCHWVLIHDGARPFVERELIACGLDAAAAAGAAVAAVPVKDTIKSVDRSGFVVSTPDRGTLWAAQTPQVFRCGLILDAYRRLETEVTDDAQAVELAGSPVKIYMGSYDNIKITTPEDLEIAEAILRRRTAKGVT